MYQVQDSILLRYRLQKYRSYFFTHKDKTLDYLKAHQTHIESHLSRLYHLRNELIHEAAIKQDIEDLTSNLKYYLLFLLDQIVEYFRQIPVTERFRKATMEEFFYEFQLWQNKINIDLKNNKKNIKTEEKKEKDENTERSLKILRDVPYAQYLVL